MDDTVEFDPGYAKHITSFINNIEYIYSEINKFKNLGQKKFKFKSLDFSGAVSLVLKLILAEFLEIGE